MKYDNLFDFNKPEKLKRNCFRLASCFYSEISSHLKPKDRKTFEEYFHSLMSGYLEKPVDRPLLEYISKLQGIVKRIEKIGAEERLIKQNSGFSKAIVCLQ